jgi:hypothetical protein
MSRVALLLMFCLGACESAPARGEPRLEMYNVRDLAGSADLEKRVRQAVPAPWDEALGWTCSLQDGLLVVRADAPTQLKVREFLASERGK